MQQFQEPPSFPPAPYNLKCPTQNPSRRASLSLHRWRFLTLPVGKAHGVLHDDSRRRPVPCHCQALAIQPEWKSVFFKKVVKGPTEDRFVARIRSSLIDLCKRLSPILSRLIQHRSKTKNASRYCFVCIRRRRGRSERTEVILQRVFVDTGTKYSDRVRCCGKAKEMQEFKHAGVQ